MIMKLFNRILKPSIFIGLLAVFTHSFASSNNAEYTPREQAEYDYAYALGVQATVYGWAPVMMDVALTGMMGSAGLYGWGGWAKTHFWVDPREKVIGLLMTQYIYDGTHPAISDFRTLVYQALLY